MPSRLLPQKVSVTSNVQVSATIDGWLSLVHQNKNEASQPANDDLQLSANKNVSPWNGGAHMSPYSHVSIVVLVVLFFKGFMLTKLKQPCRLRYIKQLPCIAYKPSQFRENRNLHSQNAGSPSFRSRHTWMSTSTPTLRMSHQARETSKESRSLRDVLIHHPAVLVLHREVSCRNRIPQAKVLGHVLSGEVIAENERHKNVSRKSCA